MSGQSQSAEHGVKVEQIGGMAVRHAMLAWAVPVRRVRQG
jgi:hypothetical protein